MDGREAYSRPAAEASALLRTQAIYREGENARQRSALGQCQLDPEHVLEFDRAE